MLPQQAEVSLCQPKMYRYATVALVYPSESRACNPILFCSGLFNVDMCQEILLGV